MQTDYLRRRCRHNDRLGGKYQGGITFIENNSAVSVGTVSRYAARLTSTYLSRLVYTWILNTYGEGYKLPEPDPNEVEVLPDPGTDPGTEPGTEPETSDLPSYVVDATETFALKIAWYAKTSTSGIEQANVDALVDALKVDLEKMGFTLANITITTKGYDGNVGPSCADIIADGDVDIMIGWGGNIGSTGGMEGMFISNVSGITVGTTSRYAALLTDSDFSKIVFAWIQNTYGTAVTYPACFGWEPTAATEPGTEPGTEPDTDPIGDGKLVIGWYSKPGTSGLTADIMAQFKTALEAYLTSQSYDLSKVEIEIRDLGDGNVTSVQDAVDAAGDVDIVLGMKAFTLTKAEIKDTQEDVPMGEKTDRRIHLLSDEDIAKLVFDWLKEDGRSALILTDESEPDTDPSEKVKLVIGWYSKSGTSGLTADIMAQFKTALEAYLTSQSYDLSKVEIEIRDLGDGNVTSVQDAVDAAGDVDIVLGMKAFTLTKAEIKDTQENVPMGGKTDRRIHRLSDSDISKLVFEWLKTDAARNTLVVVSD